MFQRAGSNGGRLLREFEVMWNTKCALDVKWDDKSSSRKSGVQVNLCLRLVTLTTFFVQATEERLILRESYLQKQPVIICQLSHRPSFYLRVCRNRYNFVWALLV